MEKAIPICQETAHLIPRRYLPESGSGDELPSIWDLLQIESYTRRDDEKNENIRGLISQEVRGLIEAQAREEREKRGTAEDVAGKTGRKQQMRYSVETLVAGTKFFWGIALQDATELEWDALCINLAEFQRWPYLGGKSGVGHGKVAIEFDSWKVVDPRLPVSGKEVGVRLGQMYLNYLEENSDKIRGLVDALV